LTKKWCILIVLLCAAFVSAAQTGELRGVVTYLGTGKPVSGAYVSITALRLQTQTNEQGLYILENVPYGKHVADIYFENMQHMLQHVEIKHPLQTLNAELVQINQTLQEVKVISIQEVTNGYARLKGVDGFGIYEAKKTELIVLKDLNANMATNNARQVFGKIPGLNIWESDAAGLQLGIGGRGLSPNRTSNFNTRQNGYDISADALGYPETYYTPPMEALERIEIVRGAASLQYGTQFGGMLNFVFKKGSKEKPIEVVSRQSLGAFGFFGTFNSVGGTVANGKVNYYTFYSHKQGDGWRPNSQFGIHTAYASVTYDITKKLELNIDYTFMHYNAQQPGGLTDFQFENDPRQSLRARNWFMIDWNLFALTANYKFNEHTKINVRNFGLLSQRSSLGNLERINVVDFGGNRTLIKGDFANMGNETRLLHQYKLIGKLSTLLVGSRAYLGNTRSRQGDGNSGQKADYIFLTPHNLEGSDYRFLNVNYAAFAENILRLNEKWSITPGVRYEYIKTAAEGYYKILTRDFAGNVVADTNIASSQKNGRAFVFGGIGISFKALKNFELYGNISQNYRAVNFNDLRIVNPNAVVDANMRDERGYSADLGFRGGYKKYLQTDVTFFLLSYNDRIGNVLRADRAPLFQDYRFRTNVADSRNTGVECFTEIDVWQIATCGRSKHNFIVFNNIAYVDARYIRVKEKAIQNKKVEMAPEWMVRSGITYRYQKFSTTLQSNYVSEHFTDATNAVRVAGAVNGIIPLYHVMDWSMAYSYNRYIIEANCNNLLNTMYFTRRADAYPGPGIIPSDGRSFFITIGIRI
jgi:Fe(3+) dicitrate transport protein